MPTCPGCRRGGIVLEFKIEQSRKYAMPHERNAGIASAMLGTNMGATHFRIRRRVHMRLAAPQRPAFAWPELHFGGKRFAPLRRARHQGLRRIRQKKRAASPVQD